MRRRLLEERAPEPEAAAASTDRSGVPQPDAAAAGAILLAPAAVAHLVANPATRHVTAAHGLLLSLPAAIRQAAHQPEHASALFLALALDRAPEARGRQLAYLEQQCGAEMRSGLDGLLLPVDALTAAQRMPVSSRLRRAAQLLSSGTSSMGGGSS